MPAVNALDPYDAFLKDARGDLVMTLARTNMFSAYSGAEFRGYYLQTRKGKKTLVYQPTPARREQVKSNCHGLTFLAGEYWMMDDQVEKILADDRWEIVRLENVQRGDVAIYRNPRGKIVHSAKVVGRDERGHVLVDSKNGYESRQFSVWAYKPIAD